MVIRSWNHMYLLTGSCAYSLMGSYAIRCIIWLFACGICYSRMESYEIIWLFADHMVIRSWQNGYSPIGLHIRVSEMLWGSWFHGYSRSFSCSLSDIIVGEKRTAHPVKYRQNLFSQLVIASRRWAKIRGCVDSAAQ